MRSYLLVLAAGAALASPAAAQNAGPYLGVEGGLLFLRDTRLGTDVNVIGGSDATFEKIGELDHKRGYNAGVVAGYDLGGFRLEGELSLKHAKTRPFQLHPDIVGQLDEAGWVYIDPNFTFDRARATSLMGNALAEFGAGGLRVYGGGGLGRARVKMLEDRDGAWAWQLIAGVGVPVSPRVELGAKYRYFQTGKLDLEEVFGANLGRHADFLFRNDGRFRSHSLLASFIFGFGASARPAYAAPAAGLPPPPAPAPATQTCPDGSVILATEVCAPPPPPPPPPAPGERG